MEWLKLREQPVSGWLQWLAMLLAGLLVGIFVGTVTYSTPVFAADATWDGQSLAYEGNSYSEVTDSAKKTALGLSNETVFEYLNPIRPQESLIIYFPAGSTPGGSTSATHVIYDRPNPGTYNPRPPTNINVTQQQAAGSSGGGSSCAVEQVGWIVCGPSMWIAGGMDWIYEQLSEFLKVRPLETSNTSSTFYLAWSIMLDIANVAFIIVFLIIVYSQVSSVGVSSYGIKKILPRLVIAAVLVNMSYLICTVLIDISNIAGVEVKDMFDQILNQVVTNGTSNNAGIGSFSDVMQTFLSGGTLALAGASAVGASILSATPFFVPLMATLFVALLVALLVMAARQALIVILVIIAPLAFVCYLLPGTEKWFEKWRNTFFTMLIFFPAFAVVFGGSQLAGIIISSNAQTTVIFILGITVQLAPLAITPLILKLGGGLLNRFAGIVNDPTKGLVDRSKQWAQEKSQQIANKRTYGNDDLKGRHIFRRAARAWNYRGRRHKEMVDNYQKKADAAYEATEGHAALDKQRREIEHSKQITDRVLDAKWNEHLKTNLKAIEKDLKLRVEIDRASLGEAELKTRYETFKTGIGNDYGHSALHKQAHDITQDLAVQGLAAQSAQRVQSDQLAKELKGNTGLQNLAGEVEDLYFGQGRGSQRVLASAIQSARSANEESIKNADTIIGNSNLSDLQVVEMAKGNAQGGIMLTDDIRAAAVRKIAGGKNAFALNKMLNEVDFSTMPSDFHQEMGEALLSNASKPPWIGGVASAMIKEGTVTGSGHDFVVNSMEAAINNNKLSAEVFVSTDATYLNDLKTTLKDANFKSKLTAEAVQELRDQISLAKTNHEYSGRIGERKDAINDILSLL